MKYQSLNSKAQTMAIRYEICEKELLQIIIEVDKKKAYLHWEHNSLFAFVSKGLGLSPAVTSNFVTVARKSHEVPALKENIIQGKDLSRKEETVPNRKEKTKSGKDLQPITQMRMLQTYSMKSKSQHRKAIPAKVRHQVQLRDGSRCTHIDENGFRCSSRRYLELHHKVRVCEGGEDTVENLTLLCHGHHRFLHLRGD